jgi:hypothetical protein
MEFSNRTREMDFAGTTSEHTLTTSHPIHWLAAKIDKITAERPKGIEEFAFWQRWQRSLEYVSKGTVKPRICLIEETSRGRWRFTHK